MHACGSIVDNLGIYRGIFPWNIRCGAGKKGRKRRIASSWHQAYLYLSSKQPRTLLNDPMRDTSNAKNKKWHRAWKKRGIEMKISNVPRISKIVDD